MVQLTHNGDETALDPLSCPSLGQAFERCTGAGDAQVAALVRVRIDGKELPEEEWDEARSLATRDLRAIEIESRDFEEAARSGLRQAREYGVRIDEGLVRVCELLRTGSIREATALYAVVLDAISVWSFAVTSAPRQLGDAADALDGLESALAPWLISLEQAQQANDWLTVADLLEFEVRRVVGEWSGRLARFCEGEGEQ